MAQIKIKDRDEQIEGFRLACNLADLPMNYHTADLIWRIFQLIQQKGMDLDMRTIIKERSRHDQHWINYFKDQQEADLKKKSKKNESNEEE